MEIDKVELYKQVVEDLNMDGYESSFYEDYSGRGMYGKTCPGIVSSAPGTVVGAAVITSAMNCFDIEDAYEASDLVPERQDSMGLSTIYY